MRNCRCHLDCIVLKGSGEFVVPLGKQLFMLTLKEEDLKIYLLGCIIDHVDIFCNSVEVKNCTRCSYFRESITDRFRYLQNSEILLNDNVGSNHGYFRLRRGILNFVGELDTRTVWHFR